MKPYLYGLYGLYSFYNGLCDGLYGSLYIETVPRKQSKTKTRT